MVNYIFWLLILSLSSFVFADNSEEQTTDSSNVTTSTVINDPTRPLGYQVKPKKKSYRPRLPVLQSIVVDNSKRRAIMNNKYYEIGQKVNGYKVSRIEKNAVHLVYRSKTYTVSLYSYSEQYAQ